MPPPLHSCLQATMELTAGPLLAGGCYLIRGFQFQPRMPKQCQALADGEPEESHRWPEAGPFFHSMSMSEAGAILVTPGVADSHLKVRRTGGGGLCPLPTCHLQLHKGVPSRWSERRRHREPGVWWFYVLSRGVPMGLAGGEGGGPRVLIGPPPS